MLMISAIRNRFCNSDYIRDKEPASWFACWFACWFASQQANQQAKVVKQTRFQPASPRGFAGYISRITWIGPRSRVSAASRSIL
jgi:hypothetical protein